MPIVSNTSPVIALARIRRLSLPRAVYGTVLIPGYVKVECVDRGKEVGAADVHDIEEAIRQGWMKVITLGQRRRAEASRLMDHAGIGPGEAEAIILARVRRLPAILDDAEARAVARGLEVEHKGTVMVPYEAFASRLISRDEFMRVLSDLSNVLWVSSAVIAEIVRRAEGARR